MTTTPTGTLDTNFNVPLLSSIGSSYRRGQSLQKRLQLRLLPLHLQSQVPTRLASAHTNLFFYHSTFNKAVDSNTVSPSTFTLKNSTGPITGVVSLNGLTAKFDPTSLLSSSTLYSDTVTTGVKDLAGTLCNTPDNDVKSDKQSVSADSIKRDRALFYKYLDRDNDKNKVTSEQTKVNNRPVAINDEATTESNIPVNINILSNDKDPDGDKLSVMAVSRPQKGTIESNADGAITYSPLKSWSGTERFGYTISDGRGGVATGTVTVIVENQPPEAEDQDISVNANNPIKIKLEAKDPDDDKLKFVLDSKPSHGRIAQFSSSTGTLAYIPDANYGGKDGFTFKVHDGTVFSKDAKVSIKIEKNEKLSKDQVKQNDKQPNRERPSQSPTAMRKSRQMTRVLITMIRLQATQAKSHLLQVKTQNNR